MFSGRQPPIQSLFRSTFLEVPVDVERLYQPFHQFQWPDELPPDCGETLSLLTPECRQSSLFKAYLRGEAGSFAPCSAKIFSFWFRADLEVQAIKESFKDCA